MLRQNILISNANKSNLSSLNNDIYSIFPSTLFFKVPKYIELMNLDIKSEIGIFGNTNNTMIINYNSKDYLIVAEFESITLADSDLASCLEDALNHPRDPYNPLEYKPYDITFSVQYINIENIVSNYNIERDASTSAFTISSSKPCTYNFNHKDSIGPIMGFGNGIYENKKRIQSTSTQSLSAYNYINVNNISGGIANPTTELLKDINCKMVLFNSNNEPIPNIDGSNDATISLNIGLESRNYISIDPILEQLTEQLNLYSNFFSPPIIFIAQYDSGNDIVTIGKTDAFITSSIEAFNVKFGIGFDFSNTSMNNSSGSLHSILGFRQKNYFNLNYNISSTIVPRIFNNTFAGDYLLICSDIVNNATDINVIGIGNGNNIKNNNILFAIPLIETKNFSPFESSRYRIKIDSSNFSQGYRNNKYSDSNPNYVNFYIRLLSGRHIICNAQYSLQLSFLY